MPDRDEELAALRLREERLRLALETAGEEFWEWDLSTDTWIFSDGLCRALGYQPDELEPSIESWQLLLHPDERQRIRAALEQRILEGPGTFEVECRGSAKDGGQRWLLCRGRATSDDSGATTKILGVHIDITRRREAEIALQASDDRYLVLVESQGEGIGIVDPDERFVYANPAAERIFGLTPGSMVGKSLEQLVDAEDYRRVLEQTDRRRDGSRDTYELGFVHTSGEHRTMLVTATPREDDDGNYAGAFGVFRDITARKRVEEALREGEERYRQLIDSLPHGVVVLQGEAAVFANAAAVRMMGYETLNDAVAVSPLERLAESERARIVGLLRGLRGEAAPAALHYVTRVIRADGTEIPVETFVTVVTHRGAPALQMVMMDISERRHAEEERARLEAELHRAQRLESIGRLAGGIAHDFNNLLSPILLYAELALQDMTVGDQHYEDFNQIRRAVQHAKELTQQLLAFGRRQILQMKVVELNRLVEDAHAMLRRLIREDIDLVLELAPALGRVRADRSQLQQVIMNLALNARDSMPQGGMATIRTRNVTVADDDPHPEADLAPGRYVCLTVADTGAGMPPEVVSQIFEPFFTTKDSGKGVGLGLSTVHGVVKQHGGEVTVQSEIDRGTVLSVYLPRVDSAPAPAAHPTRPSERPPVAATILLVEDDAKVRGQLLRILDKRGFKVIEAVDGQDALERAAECDGDIDLLLTDVIMPRLNGAQLYQRLTEVRPRLRVVYISGYPHDVIADHGVLREGIRLLQKPFTMHNLIQTIREALAE